jgi:hypothetical protein
MSPDRDQVVGAAQEEWRPIKHYEGMYSVSSLGRVRSEDREITRSNGRTWSCKGRILKPAETRQGMLYVVLSWKGVSHTIPVHDLVAAAFLGPRPKGLAVKHGPGGKHDNRPENLAYGLPMDRSEVNSLIRATVPRGEAHSASKLDEQAVRLIRSLPRDRSTVSALAEAYGVSTVTIYSVLKRKTWAHVA